MVENEIVNWTRLSKKLIKEPYKYLTPKAKSLYLALLILDNTYHSQELDGFWRSDKQLQEDTNLSISSIKRARTELIEFEMISTRLHHFENEYGVKNSFSVTVYKILELTE